MHGNAPVAAGPEVEFLECIGEASWPPPAREPRCIAERFEDELPRPIEDAGGNELAIVN